VVDCKYWSGTYSGAIEGAVSFDRSVTYPSPVIAFTRSECPLRSILTPASTVTTPLSVQSTSDDRTTSSVMFVSAHDGIAATHIAAVNAEKNTLFIFVIAFLYSD
jgi:hypothetical protein